MRTCGVLFISWLIASILAVTITLLFSLPAWVAFFVGVILGSIAVFIGMELDWILERRALQKKRMKEYEDYKRNSSSTAFE